MTRLSRSACAGSSCAVERGLVAGGPLPSDEGDELEGGAAQAAARVTAARSAARVVLMAYLLVLTLRLLTTAFTPFTLQAILAARCFISGRWTGVSGDAWLSLLKLFDQGQQLLGVLLTPQAECQPWRGEPCSTH
jgi:hypothetical protein